MYVCLYLYGCRILALIDTGASRSILRRNEFEELCKITGRAPILKKTVQLIGVTGHDLTVLGSTEFLESRLGNIELIVVEGIGHPMILGRDVLSADGANIDYNTGSLYWRGMQLTLLPHDHALPINSLGKNPPKVKDNIVEQFVNRHQDIFAAKGENLGCHPEIMV